MTTTPQQNNPVSEAPQEESASELLGVLSEASAASLDELMNRQPDYSDAEVDTIIGYYRNLRERFAIQEATPKEKKSRKKKSATEIVEEAASFF